MSGVKGRSGGTRPGAGRPKRARKVSAPKAEAPRLDGPDKGAPAVGVLYSDPRDYLMAVMNDHLTDEKLRIDAAKALMPFIHGRIAEAGKKEAKTDAAKKAASRFAAAAPPKLVVNNRR